MTIEEFKLIRDAIEKAKKDIEHIIDDKTGELLLEIGLIGAKTPLNEE